MKPRRTVRDDRGITLTEVLMAVVVLAIIIGAVAATFSTALTGSASVGQKVRESNDAQLISAWLIRDAQAVGGIDPATGKTDPSLGVSTTDAAGCTTTGTLLVRFKWIDRSPAPVTNSVTYYHDAGSKSLTRRHCATASQSVELGRFVESASATCDPACTGIPSAVSLTVTETNNPSNAPSPFTYTLSAAVRPEDKTTDVTLGNADAVPLLALGGGVCPAVSSIGNANVQVNGDVVVNATNIGACNIMSRGGSSNITPTGSINIVSGGTCSGCASTPNYYSPAIANPLAGLPAPAHNCGSGGTNPPIVGNQLVPGVYPQFVSLGNGSYTLNSGTFVFCQGIRLLNTTVTGTGVFLYLPGGVLDLDLAGQPNVALSAPSSGPYRGIVYWQVSSLDLTLVGGVSGNTYGGIVYAPNATVYLSGNSDMVIGSLVAQRIAFDGSGTSFFGPTPPTITGPASLPNGLQGQPYASPAFTATGGTPAYTWSASNLHAGLSINAASGVISGTPTQSGTRNVTVTVTDANGQPASVNRSLVIAPPAVPPAVIAVQLINGASVAGRIEKGDKVVIYFDQSMAVSSFCSIWSNNNSDQQINGNSQVSVSVLNGGAANDTLTVSATVCNFNFGAIDLGSTGYVTGTVNFGGNGANRSKIEWDVSDLKLTIELGQPAGAATGTVANSVAVYTPDADITSAVGLPVAGPFTTANVKHF